MQNMPFPSFVWHEQQYTRQHSWGLCMTSAAAEGGTDWPSKICHANSATGQQMDLRFCMTNEGEEKLCTLIRGAGAVRWRGNVSNVKMSGSGRLPGLSCTFCMTPDVCEAYPSITDFVRVF